MFVNPFDVYAKYTRRKNELCACVAEARKLLQQLNSQLKGSGGGSWVWKANADTPTDQQLKELMERLVNDRIQVIVMGETKNGKSTFINALLGAEVLPSANVPCTSLVCSVQYADTKYALVTRRDREDAGAKELVDLKYTKLPTSSGFFGWGAGFAAARPPAKPAGAAGGLGAEGGLMLMGGSGASTPTWPAKGAGATPLPARANGSASVAASDAAATPASATKAARPSDELRRYVQAERRQRDTESPYSAVEVFWPLPLLKHQVVLIDTPGLNERASMDSLVRTHLPKADAVIFLLNGTKAITDVEARAISEVRTRLGHEHMFLVVNKTDQIDASELDETQRWVRESAAEMLPAVASEQDRVVKGVANRELFLHFVSATDALRAAERGEEPPRAFHALHECIGKYLNAEKFRPKLLSGSAALLHALRAVVGTLEGQLRALRETRRLRAERGEWFARMALLAQGKQARLENTLGHLSSALREEVAEQVLVCLHALLPRVEEIGLALDASSFTPARSLEFAKEVLAEIARALEAEFAAWASQELLPVVEGAYDDLIAATRSELADLVRELKLLDGLAFGGLNGMRLGQTHDAKALIANLDFVRALSRANTGAAAGGGCALVGAGLVVKAVLVGALGVLSLTGVGGALVACMGGAVGLHHAHTLSHLSNSAPEIQLQAALEMQARLAAAIDDPTERGLVRTLSEAAVKPIDDAVRHIYGTLAMQLSSVEKMVQALETERVTLDQSAEVLEATIGAWNKLITRTEALLAT
jgi:GTP-binding protein EngB required for normal cell division